MVLCLGSVLDEPLLRGLMQRGLMQREKVQTVYHAAAYKHVPIVEANVQCPSPAPGILQRSVGS